MPWASQRTRAIAVTAATPRGSTIVVLLRQAVATAVLCAAATLTVAAGKPACDANLLTNGDFTSWTSDNPPTPESWSTIVGATNSPNDGATSTLTQIEGGGMQVAGGDGTTTWLYPFQEVAADVGDSFLLSGTITLADGTGTVGAQNFNSWMGCFTQTASSGSNSWQRVGGEVVTPMTQGEPNEMLAGAGAATGTTLVQAAAFLSMSGSMDVQDLCLQRVDSYTMLVQHMDRYYSHFGSAAQYLGIDWATLTESYRSAAADAADTVAFGQVVVEMLGELQDLHVHVQLDGQTAYTYIPPQVPRNYDPAFTAAKAALSRTVYAQGSTFIGRTSTGCYAYFSSEDLLYSAAVSDSDFLAALTSLTELLDDEAPAGLIIDLRGNIGGDEARAAQIATLLNGESSPVEYARQKFRSGWDHDAFVETPARSLAPRADAAAYGRPVVVLTGRHCVSSCEGFVAMLRALPNVTIVGNATGGASANPSPITLGNGLTVVYSRWVAMLPDGTEFERVGIAPDISFVAEATTESDRTFDKAIEVMQGLAPSSMTGTCPGRGGDGSGSASGSGGGSNGGGGVIDGHDAGISVAAPAAAPVAAIAASAAAIALLAPRWY